MLKALLVGIVLALLLFAADWIGQHNYGRLMGAVIFFALIPIFLWEVVDLVKKWLR